jgi:hypothetical protein
MVLALVLLSGCRGMRGSAEMPPMPTKPAPFPQMKMLETMAGTWAGTGEMVEPDPETIRAMMPESERAKFKSTFAGGGKTTFELDGATMRSEGWYEMPDNQKGKYLEYWTWCPREGKFRTWFASDWSESGSGWVTPSADGRCFQVEGKSADAMGNKKSFEGCMCIIDNDTMEWNFVEKGPMGKFGMRGTSKRQK